MVLKRARRFVRKIITRKPKLKQLGPVIVKPSEVAKIPKGVPVKVVAPSRDVLAPVRRGAPSNGRPGVPTPTPTPTPTPKPPPTKVVKIVSTKGDVRIRKVTRPPIKKRQIARRKQIRVRAKITPLPPIIKKPPVKRRAIITRPPTTKQIREEKGFFVLEAPTPPKKGQETEFAIRQTEKIRLRLRTKIERGQKLTIKENLQLAGAVASKRLLETSLAIESIKKVPEKTVKGIQKLIKDPEKIKKVPEKTLKKIQASGKSIKVGAEDFGRTLRVSPTEAITLIGTEVLFLKGSGKALSVVGKASKATAKSIKPIIKKEGKPLRFIGVQEQVGDKIISKVIFSEGKGRGGVAIGITKVDGRKVASVTFGKVGKFKFKKVKGKRRLKEFKQKGVFAGREVSRIRRRKLRIVGKSRIGTIVRNVSGITQIGLGEIAVARGRALLKPGRKIGVVRPVPKKVKGLKIEKFISFSAVFTNKDLSLIVGRTLRKKKDISSFIGLIKGQSSIDTIRKFSVQKQRLFKQALSDVAGTISASTKKGRSTIPKLSPKSRTAIINRVSKIRGVPLVVVKGKLKQATREQIKLRAPQRLTQEERLKLAGLEKQVRKERTKLTQKERTKLRSRQRQAQKLRLKIKQKAKQKIVRVRRKPRVSRIPVKVRARIPVKFKRKKVRRVKKKPTPKQAFNVLARPLKKKGQKKRPKLVKVNKRPLSKQRAKDLRNNILDTSLARTGRIKPTKGKPKQPKLKVPKSFSKRTSKKFRRHRTSKGKRISLPKGKVIEKRKFLLDTKQEKKQISLRRRIKQLSKPKRRKTIRTKKSIKSKGRKK